MTDSSQLTEAQPVAPAFSKVVATDADVSRISFERLRERTDELELLISGLITFALFSMPGWIMDRYAEFYAGLSATLLPLASALMSMGVGICYLLGAAFVMHLGSRAYWVGLIGLKSVYPDGIRYDRLGTAGPITKEYLRERLPSLQQAIDDADRFGSRLFAIITLIALLAFIGGLFLVPAMLLTGYVIEVFDIPEVWAIGAVLGLVGLLLLLVMAVTLLDAVWVARKPERANDPFLRRWVMRMRRWIAYTYPERMIAPVQYTLQTQLQSRALVVALSLAGGVVPIIGMLAFSVYRDPSLLANPRVISREDLKLAQNSAHYEDQWQTEDRLRLWPSIPSDFVGRRHVRLLLPYFPVLHDALAKTHCVELSAEVCLRQFWKVELDGRAVDLQGFHLVDRRDLKRRGLQGYVDLAGLAFGPHELRVQRVDPASTDNADKPTVFHLPFIFSPELEGVMLPPVTPVASPQAAPKPVSGSDEAAPTTEPAQPR
jgi:MFS family permease